MEFDSEHINESNTKTEIEFKDTNVEIYSETEQTIDAETFIEMFENKCGQQRQTQRQVRDMENRIEELIDERPDEIGNLQAYDDSKEQNRVSEDVERGDPINSIQGSTIRTYGKIQEGRDKLEKQRQRLEDIEKDLREMAPVAKEICETFDSFEMPEIWEQAIEEELEGEE